MQLEHPWPESFREQRQKLNLRAPTSSHPPTQPSICGPLRRKDEAASCPWVIPTECRLPRSLPFVWMAYLRAEMYKLLHGAPRTNFPELERCRISVEVLRGNCWCRVVGGVTF